MNELIPDWDIYLLNLPERTDRLLASQREFARLGWRVGPGGVTLFSATKFLERGGFPSASVRGAFHSHFECLKAGLKKGVGDVVLLEDDIAFADCLPMLLPSLRRELAGKEWDFCYLGHEQTGHIERASSRTVKVSLVPHRDAVIGLHFCIVNRRILSRLVAHLDCAANGREGDNEFGPMPIDGAFNVFRRLDPGVHTLIADPKLGWQRPSRSDITPRFFDRLELLRPGVTFLRDIKHTFNRWRS